MAVDPPTVVAERGAARGAPRGEMRSLTALAALGVLVVLLEVTVMPYIQVADGIPDLICGWVVAVGVLRGPLVGGVAGFCAGLLAELTAPVGTLGVLALLYLAVGAFCGRYTDRPEAAGLVLPLSLMVVAAGFVQVGYAVTQALLGTDVSPARTVIHLLLPQMALTALLGPPVLLVVRRVLKEPRTLEPYLMSRS
jgi:rod shape-determining protein MreD